MHTDPIRFLCSVRQLLLTWSVGTHTLRGTVDVSIFSQEMLWSRFCIHWSACTSLTGGLISWVSDYVVLVATEMMKVNDLWQFKKGFEHLIPFIAVHAYIMYAFKIHCTKQRCELPPAAFWMEFLSSSCWKDLIKLQQLSTTLIKDKRVTSLGFIFWNEKKNSSTQRQQKDVTFSWIPSKLGVERDSML